MPRWVKLLVEWIDLWQQRFNHLLDILKLRRRK